MAKGKVVQETISSLETYGYIFLFFYSLGGGLVGIVAAGVLSALGKMDLTLSIFIASIANLIGSTLLAYLGRYQKKEFQKYIKQHRGKVALVRLWLIKYGVLLIFANKYIYGFKTLLPLIVGMSAYSLPKFSFYNAIASCLWGILMGISGFLASNLAMEIFEKLKSYPYAFPLIFVFLVIVIWILLSRREKHKKYFSKR